MRRVLVTGGCGFIGSHLVRRLLREHDDLEVVNIDLLTYAGRPENVADLADDPRYRFVQGDIASADDVARAAEGVDGIINVAAESHVDRSIMGGDEFVTTNVLGTKRLLDHARAHGLRYLQVSTDEVYGDVDAPHRSVETFRECVRLASLYGYEQSLHLNRGFLGYALARMGDPQEGAAMLSEAKTALAHVADLITSAACLFFWRAYRRGLWS